ncbi:ATP-binding protein [Thermodesulfobacteriota bacterium]
MRQFAIFVSSVQKELQEERRTITDYILKDPLLKLFISDVFLFENLPARDQQADEAYLNEVDRCDIYIGLFGNEYGHEDAEGVSPTEHEFDRATEKGKYRLIFIKGQKDKGRHKKMRALIRKAGNQLIRRRFDAISDLISDLYASLIDFMSQNGVLPITPFDASPQSKATLRNISKETIVWFLKRARKERKFPLKSGTPAKEVLEHLNLLEKGKPKNAALLLFSGNPQKFIPISEIKCLHFHGTQIQKPIPSYQMYKGNLFEQVDNAVDFVMSKLVRSVGTRAKGVEAPVEYEIPHEALAEAIVNAIAHRDYSSNAGIQLMVFSDRVEIWNPGQLPSGLTPEWLRTPHSSIPRNPLIADPLFLAHYIEKAGTGTLDMIRLCRETGLPEPDFKQRGNQFVVTLWRDWLTEKFVGALNLNDRQKKAFNILLQQRRMTNTQYQEITGVSRATAKRDLEELVQKGLIILEGAGRGAHYRVPKKRLINDSNGNETENGS